MSNRPRCFGTEWSPTEPDCAGVKDPHGKYKEAPCSFFSACGERKNQAVQEERPQRGVQSSQQAQPSQETQQIQTVVAPSSLTPGDSLPLSIIRYVTEPMPPIHPYVTVPEPIEEGESPWNAFLRTLGRSLIKALGHTVAHHADQVPFKKR